MKKRVYVSLFILMILVGLYYLLVKCGVEQKFRSKNEQDNQEPKVETNLADGEYSDYEIALMREKQVGGIGYLHEPIMASGYIVEVKDTRIYDSWQDIGLAEFEENYNQTVDTFEYIPNGTPCMVVDVVITNENADNYFNNNVKVDLCMGHLEYQRFDDNGKFVDASELIFCTNDQVDPFSTLGFMYDLEIGESYEGKLVYPLVDGININCHEGLYVGFTYDPNDPTEEKVILLEERPSASGDLVDDKK